ncbi:hypothetical protein I551_2364 [Mycobacterium ulcerans str. Harvey]|uniref:Uncharacterized protein n=1 Tax=Mycobacterium ulcerans str. Harvey TaxID=1299332 RepID=A0ABP3AJ80_MYCUL|nr:hypothetical protein I551_2364 [Mycobacterium ulcerans str. Harvey]
MVGWSSSPTSGPVQVRGLTAGNAEMSCRTTPLPGFTATRAAAGLIRWW